MTPWILWLCLSMAESLKLLLFWVAFNIVSNVSAFLNGWQCLALIARQQGKSITVAQLKLLLQSITYCSSSTCWALALHISHSGYNIRRSAVSTKYVDCTGYLHTFKHYSSVVRSIIPSKSWVIMNMNLIQFPSISTSIWKGLSYWIHLLSHCGKLFGKTKCAVL